MAQKGRAGTFGNDQKLVGIAGDFGTVNFGAINNASLYNYQILLTPSVGTSYGGGFGSVALADPTGTVVRFNNTLEYKTPTLAGFSGQVQYSAKQKKAANADFNATLGALNYGGMSEVSVKYANGPLTAAVTHLTVDTTGIADTTILLGAARNKSSLTSLAAAYDLGNGLRLSAGTQQTVKGGADGVGADQIDRRAYQVAAIYTVGANTFTATTAQAKDSVSDKKTTFTGVAYKYALSKMTSLEAKYETADDKAGTIAAPAWPALTGMSGAKRVRTAVGINVNF